MEDGNQFAKVVEKLLRRTEIVYPGQELTAEDKTFVKGALLVASGLVQDLLSDNGDALRSWCSFISLPTIDIQRIALTVKAADGVLKQYPVDRCSGKIIDLGSFKHFLGTQGLYWGLQCPFRDIWANYFVRPNPRDFRVLNQWINLLGRLNLRSVDLTESCERDYKEFEREVEGWSYDDQDLVDLNAILRSWLAKFSWSGSIPVHGPGSVSGYKGRMTPETKDRILSWDLRLDYFLQRNNSDDPYQWFPQGKPTMALDRVCEVICVPKSITKNRTISKEPCVLQYYQQGIFHSLSDYFDMHPYLHHIISLHDQIASRKMARRGSVDGDLATIDLSSASDSVSLALVKAAFKGTTLMTPLICLRSDRARLTDGSVLQLKKFAPMGSALCFPTECLIFAAFCELAVLRVEGHHSSKGKAAYRVYGDDIVIKRKYAECLIDLLTKANFSVNKDKSFTTIQPFLFREACGGEYANSVDVAPVRFSRWIKLDRGKTGPTIASVETACSWVDLANRLFDHGLLYCRRMVFTILRNFCSHFEKLLYWDAWRGDCLPALLPTAVRPWDGSDRKPALALYTFPDCCTNWRLTKRRVHQGPVLMTEYACALFRVEQDVSKLHQFQTIAPESFMDDTMRYFEHWRRVAMDDGHDRTSYGVWIAPEPVVLDPVCLKWQMQWRSTTLK